MIRKLFLWIFILVLLEFVLSLLGGLAIEIGSFLIKMVIVFYMLKLLIRFF